jgi:hypothetical protein
MQPRKFNVLEQVCETLTALFTPLPLEARSPACAVTPCNADKDACVVRRTSAVLPARIGSELSSSTSQR